MVKTYLISHIRALFFSLGRLARSPLPSSLTIAVIGVALALPLILYVILQNSHSLSDNWSNSSTQISIYLKKNLPKIRTQDLLTQLKNNPEIAATTFIPAKKGLQQFATTLQAQRVITALKTNPLPDLVIIHPILSLHSPLAISKLLNTLQNLPEVASAQLDMKWLQRLNSIINLAKKAVSSIAFLLGIAILLIISNTIRSATYNERKEIAVLRLVGATNAFIRRPFFYIGLWYGLFGGILAWIIVDIIIWSLQNPVAKLAMSYGSDFYLQTLNPSTGIHTVFISAILGISGSWIATKRS